MNIVKRITQHRALRAQVQAWCAEVHERLNVRREDPRTIPSPPDGYRKFPNAVELENTRTRALCKIKSAEHEATSLAIEKLRHARRADTEQEQYLALCQILPSEVELLSYMDQMWVTTRLRDLVTGLSLPIPPDWDEIQARHNKTAAS